MAARLPSRRLYAQITSPVFASSATTERRVPAVVYSTPFTMTRRAFQLVLGARAEVVGLEAPRHFELVEVGRR